MIYLLDPTKYALVRPLLREMLDIHLSIVSLLKGLSPGAIFVDDLDQPKSVFGYSMRRFFLVGRPNNEGFHQGVKDFFNDTLYPNAAAMKMPHYALHYSPDDWDEVIPIILEGNYPVREMGHYYEFNDSHLGSDWRLLIPEGFTLRWVDQDLLTQSQLENLDKIIEEMQSERSSVEDFLEKSFGFCLVREDEEIVAWCMSEYNCAGRCEVGIATQEDYRRRGLATITASAVVEHALSKGVSSIGWHCDASNQPSIATALKVGFKKVCEYTEYWALTDKAMQMAMNGIMSFQRSDYEESVRWYERSIAQGFSEGWVYWNTACTFAYLGDQEKVFNYLYQAVEHGFTDADFYRNSPHLTALHDTPEWKDLIDQLENT